MSRVPSSPPPANAPYYLYDPHLGSPRDTYKRVDFTRTRTHQPEVAARFVAVVEGETVINSMWGRRVIKWRAEPGTQCLILGYWADGSVHLKWPAIARNYMVDGRFPAWVVEEDPNGKLAGGGFILRANELLVGPTQISPRLVGVLLVVCVLLIIVLVPAARDALESLLRLGR
jgi:hypothetical protein